MKNYSKYIIKKFATPYFVFLGISIFINFINLYGLRAQDFIGLGSLNLFLSILPNIISIGCFFVPVYYFSFKMSKITVDQYYTFPIKRRQLYFLTYLFGFLFILGLFLPNYLLINIYYLSFTKELMPIRTILYYFGEMLLSIIFLYTVNVFAFTRANTIGDGLMFMFLYQVVPMLVLGYLEYRLYVFGSAFWLYYGFSRFLYISDGFSLLALILQEDNTLPFSLSYIINVLIIIVTFVLFIVLTPREKAELSEDKSESWFGYKTLLPIAMFFGIQFVTYDYQIFVPLIAILTFIFYIIYCRGFHFTKSKILTFVLTIVAALAFKGLMIVVGLD